MIRRLILAVVLVLIPVLAAAQEDQPRNPKETGHATKQRARTPPMQTSPIEGQTWIGMRAHDFELDGSSGRPVKLSNLRGQWIVLVFGDRKDHFTGLKDVVAEMLQFNTRIVGICHEKSRGLESFAKQQAMPFEILADPTGQVCSVYGLYDHIHDETIPGLLILDHEGYVRMALLGRVPPPEQTARLARFAVTGL